MSGNWKSREAEKKLKRMVEWLKKNGPAKQAAIMERYGCGSRLARKGMNLAGFERIGPHYWINGSLLPVKKSITPVNNDLLKEKWI